MVIAEIKQNRIERRKITWEGQGDKKRIEEEGKQK